MNLTHLFLVAGPAGAGKSTLMRELFEGRLSPNIVGRLPAGAAGWPRVTANDIESKGHRALVGGGEAAEAAGLIVHYNIMRTFSRGYDYNSDPALNILDTTTVPMTVATILISPALLSKQYRVRIAQRNEDEWWVPVPPLKAIRRKIRVFIRKCVDGPEPPPKLEKIRLMRLYENSDALKQWYDKWRIYLRDRCEQRPHTSAIFVVPRANSQFELTHPEETSAS